MPRTVRQNILEGARKWKGPDIYVNPLTQYNTNSRISYHHGWGCNESACAGKQSTSLHKNMSANIYESYVNRKASRDAERNLLGLSLLHSNSLRSSVMLSGFVSDRRTLCAEELAGDVEGLAADNNDLLAIKQLLCDRAGKTAEQVALAVDNLGHC